MKLSVNSNWVTILILGIVLGNLFSPFFSHAEISTDGSLGEKVILTGSDIQITSDLGQIRGQNLFHSFSQFDIQTNESATFSGPASVKNIISRVTGGNASYIDGRLQSTIEGADLYLLNPSGVMFGPRATLDIQGSFHTSTADYLTFSNNEVFYTDPSKESILSVANPEAFGFLCDNPADISLDDSWLWANDGETLSIIAGNINVTGEESGAGIAARGGVVQLVAAGCQGEININAPGLLCTENSEAGAINLSDAAIYADSANASGTVIIKGGRILLNKTFVSSENFGNSDGADTAIDMEAGLQLDISNGSLVYSCAGAAGNSGEIIIKARDLNLTDTSSIVSLCSDSGDGGGLSIAANSFDVINGSRLYSSSTGKGKGSNISVVVDTLDIDGGETQYSFTGIHEHSEGTAPSGHIMVTANEIDILNGGSISTTSAENTSESSGDITIETGRLFLNHGMISSDGSIGTSGNLNIHSDFLEAFNNSVIAASTTLSGNSGFINIISENCLIDGSFISNGTMGTGNGGGISINASQLTVQNESFIESASFGTGAGGDISIRADDVMVKGYQGGTTTGITTMSQVSGDAGNIRIIAENSFRLIDGGCVLADAFDASDAGEISISSPEILLSGNNGTIHSLISTCTMGEAQAGNIEIDAKEINLSGANIEATTFSQGNGGTIKINTQNMTLSGAQIASDSFSAGDGGMLEINTTGDLILSNGLITTEAKTAEGGDIHINCKNLNLSDQSEILAKSSGAGNAGNITITALSDLTCKNSVINTQASQSDGGDIYMDAKKRISLNSGEILASVGGGSGTTGGNINLTSKDITMDDNSRIYANAFEGTGGSITISSNVFLKEPSGTIDASSQIGIDGIVEINALFTNLSGSLKPLPTDFLNAANLIKAPCDIRVKEGDYGSFTVKGRDGLPIEPGGFQISPSVDF